MSELSTQDHLKIIKMLTAYYAGKKLFIECFPTDEGAQSFPNSNRAVKEIHWPENYPTADSIRVSAAKDYHKQLEELNQLNEGLRISRNEYMNGFEKKVSELEEAKAEIAAKDRELLNLHGILKVLFYSTMPNNTEPEIILEWEKFIERNNL